MATTVRAILGTALRDIATDDPSGAAAALRAAPEKSVELLALLTYAEVISCRFSAARKPALLAVRASEGGSPEQLALAHAAHALALAFRGPAPGSSPDDLHATMRLAQEATAALTTPSELQRYLMAEASMSAGEIACAAEYSAMSSAVVDPVLQALLSQAHARALAFGGQLDGAQAEAEKSVKVAQEHGLRGVEAVAQGLLAYLAAQRSDRAELRRAARACLALASAPASNYLLVGGHALVAYALAADEQYPLAAATLLTGGGADLERLQFVDRVYGYELLAGAALRAGDVIAAQHWLGRALALPAKGMAAAAVARTEAMVRTAEGKLPAGALAAQQAAESAAQVGGNLDAARAHMLHGSALSHLGSRQEALEVLERVVLAATELGALRIRARAVREMRRLGRRVPPPGRDGSALSPREKQVALLVADGLSNRQVGRLLTMSERTVESHLGTVLRRLGVSSRAALPQALLPASGRTPAELTSRQQAVVALVTQGLTNAEIAAELEVSSKTVEKHLSDAFARCGVRSRTALAAHWQGSRATSDASSTMDAT